jgi:serine/threonine-protein kinase HipA
MAAKFQPVDLIHVGLQLSSETIPVGRLALRERIIYFEYHNDFISRGLLLSPFKLPLKPGVQSFDNSLFGGLPGVFDDSLPDGWGRLILDRALRAKNINPDTLSPLDRLAHVGHSGMGALTYEPIQGESAAKISGLIDLNNLATQASKILEGGASKVLDELVALGGSSAGARPKAMIGVNKKKTEIIHGVHDLEEKYEHWMVKFPNTTDGKDSGAIEYVYSQMAKDAGIDMEETYLFPAKNSPGFFGTKRFDRRNNEKIHLHTAAGLIHADFRAPSLDYQDLMGLTIALTRDLSQGEKLFRLAVFNVLGHNRDDHGKNFSYLMDKDGQWQISPAYDLIYSSGPNGEQSTMIMGEGRNPDIEHLLKFAEANRIPKKRTKEIIDQCRSALANWKKLAKKADVSKEKIEEIEAVINK